MENLWIYLVLIYGFLKGTRECMKKEALKKNSLTETLFFYMLVGFIFTLPTIKEAFLLQPVQIFWIFVKSVAVSIGFLLSFIAIKGLPIGIYSIMTLSQMVITTILGVIFLKEPFGIYNLIGLTLVIGGLVLVNIKKGETDDKKVKVFSLLAVVIYCFFNSVSSIMDKILMKNMSSAQLQFWFMLFGTLFYAVLIIVRKEKISVKTLKTNFWIPLMGFLLVLGDRLLFEANGSPYSKVTIMTMLLQISVIVSIVLGKIFYKEKNFIYKLFCAAIILSGIGITLI